MNKSIMTFCKKSLHQLVKISKKSNLNSVLISVNGGGCNGLAYKIEPLQEKPEKLDIIISHSNMDIVICSKSLMHLIGSEVIWLEDYMGSRFDFVNPNASSKCGCGTTFSSKS
jgi:iron-sulfur cluster assembly accessory protein